MKPTLYLLLLLSGSALAQADLPGDAAEGKRLHDGNCMKCHNTAVYTRKDRTMKSLGHLKEQLGGCSHMAGAQFSPQQAQSVLKYLNDQFYRFP